MLKGRGKAFAPKKVVRKPQALATSSVRPTVEDSSQTPAPQVTSIASIPQKVIDLDPIIETDAPSIEPVQQQGPSQEVQDQAIASVTQDGENTVRQELKRKERDYAIGLPPPKRISTSIEEPNIPTPQIEPPAGETASQETDPAPAPASEEASEPRAEAASILKPVSQAGSIAKPAAAKPRISVPKLKKRAVVETPKSQASAPRVSPEPRREYGPSSETEGHRPPIQPESSEPATQPATLSPEAGTSIPTPMASSTLSRQNEPEQPWETSIPDVPLETTEDDSAPSPLPERPPERSPEPPRHRYPSPQNIAGETPTESSSMGRAGGGGIGIGTGCGIGSGSGIGTESGSGDMLLGPGEVGQASEIVPIGALHPDGTSGVIQVDEPASATGNAAEKGKGKPKRKYTKRKKVQPLGDGEDARTNLGMKLNKPRRVAGPKKKGRKKKDGIRGRKERADTPDGASDEEIDQSTLTMTDLCKDLRIGKKFSRHKEIKDRVKANKKKNQKNRMIMKDPQIDGRLVGPAPAGEAAAAASVPAADPGSGAPAPAPDKEPSAEVPAAARRGPQVRVVDNQIVIDETSLQIDRHARARANAEEMEEVIEDDFTRVITSGTYMKREKSMLWDHAATVRFYEGLAQFGTDFEMIAKLFPHRSRRQIKLKFNKEERAHPDRVTKAMVGPKKKGIDLKNFERLAEETLIDVAVIEAEHDEYENEMLAKEKVELDAAAEITRQKKAAIQSGSVAARKLLATMDSDDENGHGGGGGQKAPRKRTLKKGGKRNMHSHYAGGDIVSVENIDY